ncbi:vWA domain-containing protein [Singulisphaera rosea]
MSVSFTPIGPWSVVVVAALVVTALTIWAYQQRLKGTTGRWRWFALGLRLAAVFLCVLAAFRPSVIVQEKKKQPSSLIFLVDDSISMKIADELGGKARSTGANETLTKGLAATKSLGPNLQIKTYAFDGALHDLPKGEAAEPKGRSTEIGPILLDAVKRQSGTKVASVVLLSDGANNGGINPDVVARQLRSQQIPVVTVGFGSESAGLNSRDVSFRDLVVGPTVFVKNQLLINGSVVARGFSNKSIDVEMFVDDDKEPVARTKVRVPEGAESVPITGLKYLPQTPGEKKITLVAKPLDNELIQTNNTVSTFVTVQAGGLNVLFLQGPHSPWEAKFLLRAIKASPDINCEEWVLRKPATDGKGGLDDAQLALGKYNAYIISDLPADHLTRTQQQLLSRAVEGGAGRGRGEASGPLMELGPRWEQVAPPVELVEADRQGDLHGDAFEERDELPDVGQVVGGGDPALLLGQVKPRVVRDLANAKRIDEEEKPLGLTEVSGLAPEQVEVHLPIFAGRVEEREQGGAAFLSGTSRKPIDERLEDAPIGLDARRGRVAVACDLAVAFLAHAELAAAVGQLVVFPLVTVADLVGQRVEDESHLGPDPMVEFME